MNLDLAASLCRTFEGFLARPYLCPAGVPTIGYGATYYPSGHRVTLQDPLITRDYAEQLLLHQLREEYLPGVLRCCPNLVAHPRRLNAIVDFAFNLGVGRLQTSTLRRKILEEDWDGAKRELRRWVRGGGRVLPGLVRRREAEVELM